MAARSSVPQKLHVGCSLQPERLDDRGRLGVLVATPGPFCVPR